MKLCIAIGSCSLAAAIGFAFAQPPQAPAPREVRPDTPKAPQDPAATLDRIVNNSNAVGERLAKTDPGPETQRSQEEILKDIDSLLQQPPVSGGNNKNNPNEKDPPKKNGMEPMAKTEPKPKDGTGAKSMPEPKPGMNGMVGTEPMAGANVEPNPRRPRSADREQKAGTEPKTSDSDAKMPDPNAMAKSNGAEPKPEPKPMPGGNAQASEQPEPRPMPMSPSGGVPNAPAGLGSTLPLDEDTAKKVWGGPREQMRKQVDQYYNERFMPGYSTLLKGYYGHLAGSAEKK